MKQCKKCGENKEFSEFYKGRTKDGLNSWCKKCTIENLKQWKIKNRPEVNRRAREYYADYYKEKKALYRIKNKQKIDDRMKKWRENNREYLNEYWKQRLKNPKHHLDKNVKNAVRQCLKGKKAGRTWESLVGYTLQDLFQHLEKQFDDKMSWQNYGSYWHIDHIVPQSWFPYQTAEEQAFKDCWGMANLQPLEAKKNISKNNRFIS